MDYELELKQKMKEIEDRVIKKHSLKMQRKGRYNQRKNIYNENRKLKRRVKVSVKFCVICKIEFQSSHGLKCTCSDECSNIHRKNLALQNYYNKKDKS